MRASSAKKEYAEVRSP